MAPKNEPRASRGCPREVNAHVKQQSTGAEKSLASTRDPTPPATRARRSGKKSTVKSLASALPPYRSDSDYQDYQDDDDVLTMTTNGHRRGPGDDGSTESAEESDGEDRPPPITRSKAKSKAKPKPKPKPRFISPDSMPESEDMLVMKPESAKRVATDVPEVQVKKRRVLSIDSGSSIEEIVAFKKAVTNVGAAKPEVVLSSRKRGKVATSKDSPTTAPTATGRYNRRTTSP